MGLIRDLAMKKKFSLGSLTLPSPIVYAPLAGCSDFPFRKMAARYSPGLMFCEMVKMEALLRKIPSTYQMLEYSEEMHPIGGQICGSNPALAAPCAKIIEDLGFDVVDFNCGCPVDKITKDGSGSGMLRTPEKIGETIANMVAAVKIPVTLKVRAGWDGSSINAHEITKIAEEAGAKAIFVHGRTRQQGYKGPAVWDHIKACKQAATSIKVIGNGDVFTPEAALRMFQETDCDAVLVSRGTMGQPWIAEQILEQMEGKTPREVNREETIEALVDHFRYSCEFKSEKGALIDMRKICCWYLKNTPGAREFRKKASHASSLSEIHTLIGEL
ncbi:MAG: putative tRNA-dihydrouridine synthase [Chlamydiae bacterium]|nr:putative tRNA-dihydrouridine synthase [Chlamydiota bacterium]